MKTVLVPVDFSKASLNAASYALDFAHAINASMTLLHVYQLPPAFSEIPASAREIADTMNDAEKKMKEWEDEFTRKGSGKIKIYTAFRQGYITTIIEEYCSEVNPYAVVMGAHGANALERFLFGSNTLHALKHLSWPLIIVPKDAKFTSISKIGLACDLRDVLTTIHAGKIKKLVNDFHAELHILHVNTHKYKSVSDKEIEGTEWIRDMFLDMKPAFHFLSNEYLEEGVNEFAEKIKPDLLIVIPKHYGLIEQIVHKSHAKEMALHTHMPLLSIHE